MADLRTLVRDEMDRAGSPSYAFEDLGRRRDRKRRNQRITAGVVGIIIALLSLAIVAQAFRDAERPASEPRPSPPRRTPSPSPQTDPTSPQGIFADVGGRIVYGTLRLRTGGIFAVDPTRPNDPKGRILVSGRSGEPLGWSSDGSRLLIRRQVPDPTRDPVVDLDLFVLNADGTETRVTNSRDWISGSISPDGSQVVYAAGFDGHIYTVDAEGGEASLASSLPVPVCCTTRRSPPTALRSHISTAGATTATASGS
jgi:hypothetical protein